MLFMRFFDKHNKKVLCIFGIIGLLISMYFLVSGGMSLRSHITTRDSEGFYSTWSIQVKRDSHAIVLKPDGINFDGTWSMSNLAPFKVEASNNNLSNQLFVGTAKEKEIDVYLNGVEYDEIVVLRIFPSRANYQNHPGGNVSGSPNSQGFWTESTYGSGIQNHTWNPELGHHSLVIMNKDGSKGIDIHLVIGTKAGLLFMLGVSNLVIGFFVLLVSLLMLLAAGRSRSVVYPEPLERMLQKRTKSKINN